MILPREQALELLHKNISNPRMIQHCLASEAVMQALALRLGQDSLSWGQAGLLHDLDVEFTQSNPLTHGPTAAQWLDDMGIDPEITDAIRMHNERATGLPRTTLLQHALAAGETITGLISATALVYPDKSVQSVKPKSVVKRMKEKAFAASVNRDNIMECTHIGIPLDEFAELAVNAMQNMTTNSYPPSHE
jgi:putative nucleotidyltransferase with HDIG domain